MRTSDALKPLNEEYLEIKDRFPGEFELVADAHALQESCRPVVEEMISKGGAKAIAVASCYDDGSDRVFLDNPRLNGYRSSRRRMTSWSTFIRLLGQPPIEV